MTFCLEMGELRPRWQMRTNAHPKIRGGNAMRRKDPRPTKQLVEAKTMRTVRLTVAIVATLLVLVDLGGLSLSQTQTILQNSIPALPNPLASKLGKSKLNAPLAAIMNP